MPDLTAPARPHTSAGSVLRRCPACRSGLYDPANEQGRLRRRLRGRRPRTPVARHRRRGPAPPCTTSTTAAPPAPSRTPATAPGILTQVPDALLRASVDFDLPPAGEYAVGIAFLPADDAERAARVDDVARLAAEEGLTVLGWRDVPDRPRGRRPRPHRPRGHAALRPAVRRRDDGRPGRRARPSAAPSPATASPGWSGVPSCCASGPSAPPVDAGSSLYIASLSSRTITYKGMLTTDQLPRSSPTCATSATSRRSRWCTAASPPTPSRAGRWPTRSASSRTTARSTPIKGNRNRMRAREAQAGAPTCSTARRARRPSSAWSGSSRCTAGDFSDSATFDEVLELLHLSGRSLPHAVLMMIPEAWENHDEMDPARRAFYRFHSSIMEPWDGPAARLLHRRHPDRRRPRPQRPAPRPLVAHQGRPGRAGQRGRRARHPGRRRRGQGPAAAGPDVPRRHRRRAGSSTTRRSRARWPPSSPTRTGCTPGWCTCPTLPERAPRRGPATSPSSAASCCSATPRRSCAILVAPMARQRRRADRLDGHRHPDRGAVGPVAAALRLLRPAVRPGDQPAAGRHPRGAGRPAWAAPSARSGTCSHADAGVVPAGLPAVPGHRQRRARQDPRTSTTTATCPASPPSGSPASSTSPAAAPALAEADRASCATKVSKAIAAGARIIVLSDRDCDEQARADPVAAA